MSVTSLTFHPAKPFFRPKRVGIPQQPPIPHNQVERASTPWLPSLKGGLGAVYFGQARKASVNANDPYLRYTPDNTATPLATWHTFVTSDAMAYHTRNAEVLEKYIQGTGEYNEDYAWVKYQKTLGEEPYTVFDTETTGLQVNDRIVQIAASQVSENHEVRHRTDFNTYLNPGVDAHGEPFRIKKGAIKTHGITPEMVKDKSTIEEILYDFCNTTLKRTGLVVAYNAKFDTRYLNNAIESWNQSPLKREHGRLRPLDTALVLDPFVMIQRAHPFVSLRKRLGDHYEIMMGRPLENKHDAQADVDATVDVLKYVFKYLQKHAIPREWAEVLDKKLEEAGAFPPNAGPDVRSSYIARLVRERRAELEAKLPAEAPPLKITDILRFQHGVVPTYDESENWPVLDISPNRYGWDGTKTWGDGVDSLDSEIVEEIRRERDQENRDYILATFRNELNSPYATEIAGTISSLLKPDLKEKDRLKFEAAFQRDMLNTLGAPFTEAFLAKTLPTSDEGWASCQEQVEQKLEAFVQAKMGDQLQSVPLVLQDRVSLLAKDACKHMRTIQQKLGDRYFYTYVPLKNDQPIVDPNVLIQLKTLEKKRKATKAS